MKTEVNCPRCGKKITSLVKSYISTQDVTLRYIKGDEYVLAEYLDYEEPEIDAESEYYQCPMCKESVCKSGERALEFLKGE